MRAICTITVDHPDKTIETYKLPFMFPDKVVIIDNGREFVDSKITLKVILS